MRVQIPIALRGSREVSSIMGEMPAPRNRVLMRWICRSRPNFVLAIPRFMRILSI